MFGFTAEAHAGLPDESPRHGSAYRNGLAVEGAIGVALCQPAPVFQGACGSRGGGDLGPPGLGLRVGAGWRFGPNLHLSAAWVRQGHRPTLGFSSGQADGGIVAARGILVFGRLDLGFELGLGYAQRTFLRGEAPTLLRSRGALVRPAIVLEGWVMGDLAVGLEIASHINAHWQHCTEARCERAPGPWVGAGLQSRFVDGVTVAFRFTGLLFPDW